MPLLFWTSLETESRDNANRQDIQNETGQQFAIAIAHTSSDDASHAKILEGLVAADDGKVRFAEEKSERISKSIVFH